MSNSSLSAIKKIHFIGVGGVSMSGLAHIADHNGKTVTGSDMKHSKYTDALEKLGIKIYYGHSKNNIESDVDLVVYTAAIHEDNEELQEAHKRGIQLMTRSQFLGELMHHFDYPICVAGTHGKTTTTSMLSHALIEAKLDPTITVGGNLKVIGGNIRLGHSKYFVNEACEYCDSFLDFYPHIGVILNIEEDHLDYFKDINQIRASFKKFALKIPNDGLLIINGEIDNLADFTSGIPCKIETFGLEGDGFDWTATNIVYDEDARPEFDVIYKGNKVAHIKLHVPGKHNVLNCLSVCSVCNYLGVDLSIVNEGLVGFTGADQRFEIKGNVNGITLVDDYAHHPTEMSATLSVATTYPHNNLYVVFQPHTYTRTKAFLEDFAKVLSVDANIIVTDIFAAREKDPGDISSKQIVDVMKDKYGHDALYMKDFGEIADYLKKNAKAGDVILTMGAGNVNQIITMLKEDK